MLSTRSFLINLAIVILLAGSIASGAELAARTVPTDAYSSFCIGTSAAETEDWDTAVQNYEKVLALDPQCIEAHLALAFINDDQLQRPVKAKYHFQKALELNPKSFRARYGMARQLLRTGQLDKASSELAEALKLDEATTDIPILSKAYTEFAFAFELAGRRQQAIEYYNKAADVAPNPLYPMLRLAYLYRSGTEYDKAIEVFKKMQEMAPTFGQINRELCDTYTLMGEWSRALEELAKYMGRRDGPGEQPALLKQAADLAEKSGNADAARTYNEKLLLMLLDQHTPENSPPNICEDIATALIGLGRNEQALPYLTRALEAADGEAKNTLRMRRAFLYDKMGKPDLCANELQTCVKDSEPQYSISYRVELAMAYERHGDQVRAEDTLHEILDIPGSRAVGHAELGRLESRRGNFDAAIKYLKKAIEEADTQEGIRYRVQLSVIYSKANRQQDAEQELVAAHELFPDNPSVSNALGWHYAERGEKLDKALGLIQDALKRSPNNAYYIDSLGWIYYKQGKMAEAREQLERAASMMQDSEIFDHLGDVYNATGDADKAAENWRRAIMLDPQMKTVQEKLDKVKKNN